VAAHGSVGRVVTAGWDAADDAAVARDYDKPRAVSQFDLRSDWNGDRRAGCCCSRRRVPTGDAGGCSRRSVVVVFYVHVVPGLDHVIETTEVIAWSSSFLRKVEGLGLALCCNRKSARFVFGGVRAL
jgi:hypothetical protein